MPAPLTRREKLVGAAWFFNGEGCTNVAVARRPNGREYATVRVMVPNSHLENLEFFQDALGGLGTLSGPRKPKKEHWKCMYEYRAQGFEEVQAVIAQLWNWLSSEKREQAYSSILRARDHRRLHNVYSNVRTRVCGTATSYNKGCRCDKCVRARQYWNYRNELRQEQLELIKDGG